MPENIATAIGCLAQSYAEAKFALEHSLPFDPDWLHPAVGLVIFLAVSRLLRRPWSSPVPWLVLAGLELLNELVDLTVDVTSNRERVRWESATDFLLTMAVPTAILLVAALRSRRRAPAA